MPAACIQLHNYDLFEKAPLKLSPLIQNRVQEDYLPESYARHLPSYKKCCKFVAPTRCGLLSLPMSLYGTPWGWGKLLPNSEKFTCSPIRKIPFNSFKSFAIKSFISSPIKKQFSSNHTMQSSFVVTVISVVSYFKFQALCTHMLC